MIQEEFEKVFGAAPDVVAQAPGRVNLIGEHIDYSEGFVLPFAIDAVTQCAVKRRIDTKIRVASAQRSGAISETSHDDLAAMKGEGWARYVFGVIWSLEIKQGLDIYIDGKVPPGAGLSSSAALECSVAIALNHIFHLEKSLSELALLTQRAENKYVGVPCGIMDQSVSLMAKAGYALLLDCRDLIDTQAHHALTDGGYAERRASCEEVAKILGVSSMRELSFELLQSKEAELTSTQFKRARHAVTEIARVLEAVDNLESKDFATFGKLLNQSHYSLRDDYTVSCPELDTAVEAALKNGALGARMVGGGFGGSAIALIAENDAGKVSLAIERAFAEKGFKAPRFFSSLPSDGAKVIS